MGVVFTVGTVLGRNDLKIFLRNSSGVSVNAYSITFGIYYVDPDTEEEVAVGSESKAPINPAVGEYYAAIIIPSSAVPGDYRIRWTLKELSTSPEQMVMQEFGVVAEGVVTGSNYSSCEQSLIKSVRTLTRDNNPDRNYHFRPPEHASTVGCYNQVFGYIWEDEEILEYLNLALMKWNSHPPETEYLDSLNRLCSMKPAWKAAIVWGAVANAAIALSFNWVSDEFSVGGSTLVDVVLPDGQVVSLPIKDLYNICKGEVGETKQAIRDAFQSGQLRVRAVNPESGCVDLHVITDVMQHRTSHKNMVRTTLVDGRTVETTVDHSLFYLAGSGVAPVEAGTLLPGDHIAVVCDNTLGGCEVLTVEILPPEEYTYDLSVPGPQNFVLTEGLLAHNSYSIGGISLDIERSSKYEGLYSQAEAQWDKLVESKSRTTKYITGIRQPKFGIGVRSAFGPNTGRGILSPRSYR